MKYLFLILPIFLNAQIVSVGFDVSNAIYGSDVNKPSLDAQIRFESIEKWGNIGIEFENFKEIDYFSWGMYANKQFALNKVDLLAGIEVIQIIRNKISFLSYGFNAETRYWIGNIGISLQYNYRWRQDLKALYNDGRFVGSGFLNIIYKWQKHTTYQHF